MFSFIEQKVQKMKWYDFSVLKLTVFAFGLLAAKLYPQLLSLAWYWYAAVFVLGMVWLLYKMYAK